jgi:hypothetical protein
MVGLYPPHARKADARGCRRGKSVIPSNVTIGTPAATIDVPLGHKDEAWSFDHFDTVTVSVADAPKPDEIVIVLAFADGGRPIPRCGTCPI